MRRCCISDGSTVHVAYFLVLIVINFMLFACMIGILTPSRSSDEHAGGGEQPQKGYSSTAPQQ